MIEPSPEFKKAQAEAESSVVTLEELRQNPSEANMNQYIEGLIAKMEEEDPAVREILEAAPGAGVNRREALKSELRKTLEVRLDGLKKGYTDEEQFKKGVEKVMRNRLGAYAGKKVA